MIYVCLLWRNPDYRYGERYGARHVNILAAMLRRHEPHSELVCFCDDPAGIDSEVRVLPLWRDFRHVGGTWLKLKLFSPEMADLVGGRFCYLDLDSVVVAPLEPLFGAALPFGAAECTSPACPYNTSLVFMEAGSRAWVWQRFTADPVAAMATLARTSKMRGSWDQGWVGHVLGLGERMWGKADGVLKYAQIAGASLPENARVVYFAGRDDPSSVDLQRRDPWIAEHWQC